jgi:hypothetical protein
MFPMACDEGSGCEIGELMCCAVTPSETLNNGGGWAEENLFNFGTTDVLSL